MRRSISKIPYRPTNIAASFSTAGGGGRGRGRGAGAATHFQFTLDDSSNHDSPPHGRGRGRGGSSPVLPSFLNNNGSNSAASGRGRGRGRGFVPTNPTPPLGEQSEVKPEKPNVRMPYQFTYEEEEARFDSAEPQSEPKPLPSGIFDALAGMGRGKPANFSPPQSQKPNAETPRTISREKRQPTKAVTSDTGREKLSTEEKVRKAVGILSRGEEGGPPVDGGVRAERGERGRERGRGSGRGRGRGRGRGEYGGRGIQSDRDDELADGPTGQYFGDPADEEKVAKRLGPQNMSKIAEGFEEMSNRVLPSPNDDALIDAYETNLMLECEPEYFMEEFGTNPDIDEKPPMSLREALEKTKPFFMKYEGIQSQEEWEEIVEATMKNVPLLKSIVDHYGGPDRVTAKQQKEELERVAKTLPASTPASVKRFTDRAVLSLQSNPGWGFNKKWQFMDKLVMEVSQQYK